MISLKFTDIDIYFGRVSTINRRYRSYVCDTYASSVQNYYLADCRSCIISYIQYKVFSKSDI